MSTYKHQKSDFYHFDFQFRGNRFYGSTGATSKREADLFERRERERARLTLASAGKGGPLTIVAAADRYWSEVGEHHQNHKTTMTDLNRLVDYFGETKL